MMGANGYRHGVARRTHAHRRRRQPRLEQPRRGKCLHSLDTVARRGQCTRAAVRFYKPCGPQLHELTPKQRGLTGPANGWPGWSGRRWTSSCRLCGGCGVFLPWLQPPQSAPPHPPQAGTCCSSSLRTALSLAPPRRSTLSTQQTPVSPASCRFSLRCLVMSAYD